MGIYSDWIRYGQNERYTGYLAKPERISEPHSVIIVIQEIWGVDSHIQELTRRFASAGYVAIAPDLYADFGKRPEPLDASRIEKIKSFLDSLPPNAWFEASEREKALNQLPETERIHVGETYSTLFGGLKPAEYLEKLVETADILRDSYPATKGMDVASVGFCMGGALSAQLATRDKKLKGAIVFYGQAPAEEQLQAIECPVLGFYGGKDHRITGGVNDFAEAMKKHGKSFDYQIYEGANHAFFNDSRSSYHVYAARDALVRALSFFNATLR